MVPSKLASRERLKLCSSLVAAATSLGLAQTSHATAIINFTGAYYTLTAYTNTTSSFYNVTSTKGDSATLATPASVAVSSAAAPASLTVEGIDFNDSTQTSGYINFTASSSTSSPQAATLTLTGADTAVASPAVAQADLITVTANNVDTVYFAGATNATSPVLNLVLGAAGNLDVATGKTLRIGGSTVLSGTNLITIDGGGTVYLSSTSSADYTYSGGLNVVGSTLQVNSGFAFGTAPSSPQTYVTLNNSTLQFSGSAAMSLNQRIGVTGASSIDVTTGITALASGIGGTGSLTKTDAGTLELTGTNTYTGTTTVAGGTLELTTVLANSNITIGGGTTFEGAANSKEPLGYATLTENIANDTADQIDNTGGTLNLSALALDALFTGTQTQGTYQIETGAYTGQFAASNLNPSQIIYGTNSITIAVPEPATVGVATLLAGSALLRRRRSR